MTGRLLLAAIILNLVVIAGCREQSKDSAPSSVSEKPPRAAIALKLLVVGDPELAEAVRLLRGEWAERSGGILEVEEIERAEFEAAELPAGDVIVYPTQCLAELVVEEKLRPVRRSVLEDSRFAFDDLLPVVRNEVMRYGGEVFAISLGETPLMLARARGLEDEDLTDPSQNRAETWSGLTKLHSHASGQPALELIARAASFVDSQSRSELLFDPKDMSPRLTAPPFQRALEQMANQAGDQDDSNGYKIVCATASEFGDKEVWRLSALPKAEQKYNSIRDRWEPQAIFSPLAVLGFAGRCASVTSSTRNATSAFKLLGWLGSGSPAMRISSSSSETTLFRNSQRHQANKWLGKSGGAAVPLVLELLSTGEPYLLARIPQIDQYLKVLDRSVRRAREGEAELAEILKSATEAWQQITGELGRDRQRRCYRLHLGLESWSD